MTLVIMTTRDMLQLSFWEWDPDIAQWTSFNDRLRHHECTSCIAKHSNSMAAAGSYSQHLEGHAICLATLLFKMATLANQDICFPLNLVFSSQLQCGRQPPQHTVCIGCSGCSGARTLPCDPIQCGLAGGLGQSLRSWPNRPKMTR